MSHSPITSLHSPHVERVKALLGSRGKKLRREESTFIADGMQSLRSAISPQVSSAPIIEIIYVTQAGHEKLRQEFSEQMLEKHQLIFLTDQVMSAMSDTDSPQGILALCKYRDFTLGLLEELSPKRIAYFWQIQDPGNAGTAIRTADACGFDAVVFSEGSVDIFSPKVVRSTAGSLWHIPVVEGVSLESICTFAQSVDLALYALDSRGEISMQDVDPKVPAILTFGNEARGLPQLPPAFTLVKIPMKGHAESFNVASAAAIALFHMAID